MSKHIDYQNIEQACDVMDKVCACPMLPPRLYEWQKEAWVYIRAYLKESQKHPATTPCCLVEDSRTSEIETTAQGEMRSNIC